MKTIQGNGFEVNTNLNYEEAVDICRQLPSGFARDLAAKCANLSRNQTAWLFRMAQESLDKQGQKAQQAQPQKPNQAKKVVGICDFIADRHGKGNGAFIEFATEFGNLTIKSASKTNPNNANVCWVSDGGTYGNSKLYGKLDMASKTFLGRNCPTWVEEILDQLNANPQEFCATYGKKTGQCCFCALPLTDEVSVEFGWGPVCADNYGLPHGKRALKRLKAERVCKPMTVEQAEGQAEHEAILAEETKAEQAMNEGFM